MSQQLGLNYQMSPEVMYITPNIWRLGIIFISVITTPPVALEFFLCSVALHMSMLCLCIKTEKRCLLSRTVLLYQVLLQVESGISIPKINFL